MPYNRGEQEECRDQSRFPKQKRKITNISRIYNYLTMNSTLDAKMSDTKDVQFSTPDFLRDLNSFLPVPSRQLRSSSSCLRKLRSTINTTTQMPQLKALREISTCNTLSSTIFPPSLIPAVLLILATPWALTAANAGNLLTCRTAIRSLLPQSTTMPNVVLLSPSGLSRCWMMTIWGCRWKKWSLA